MQQTRQHILEILRDYGEATVDDIVVELQKRRGKEITAVTVRHHLTVLQKDQLIASPHMLHRSTPGRPQHVYALTEKALGQFPNNYQNLAENLLIGIGEHLPPEGVNVILEGVASRMANAANVPDRSLHERLEVVVDYLDKQGYEAHWEECEGGYILYTSNCPYHQITEKHKTLCELDMRLMAALIGVVPRRINHVANGDTTCAYMIPR